MLKIHLAELLQRLANWLHPCEQYEEAEVWDDSGESFKKKRYEAALAVSEDDIEGFLLLILKPEAEQINRCLDRHELRAEITLRAMVPSAAWPAFLGSMRQIETFAQEHERPEG